MSLIFIILQNKRATFFSTLLQKELNNNHIPLSTTHEKNLATLLLACVAGVERGRGRGNLGASEYVWGARCSFSLTRAQIPPSPSPFNAGHVGYLIARWVRTWVVIEKRNIAIQLVMRQCCKTNCRLVRVASWVKRQVSSYVLRHCFTDCLMLGTKVTCTPQWGK